MEVIKTKIEGVVIIEPRIFSDDRGYFYESFSDKEFKEKVCNTTFVQDNQSRSSFGVVRGLHFQKAPYAQSKLVRVVEGEVLDVAVDIRKGSPTYGEYVAVILSAENHKQLFIPRGFAHGFAVLSDTVLFQYKCDNLYNKESEGSLLWNDKDLNIKWNLPLKHIVLSEKDRVSPIFKDFVSPFNYDDNFYEPKNSL